MKILNVNDVEAKEVSKEPLFFGGKVQAQFVLEEESRARKSKSSTLSLRQVPATSSIPTQLGKSLWSLKAKESLPQKIKST